MSAAQRVLRPRSHSDSHVQAFLTLNVYGGRRQARLFKQHLASSAKDSSAPKKFYPPSRRPAQTNCRLTDFTQRVCSRPARRIALVTLRLQPTVLDACRVYCTARAASSRGSIGKERLTSPWLAAYLCCCVTLDVQLAHPQGFA